MIRLRVEPEAEQELAAAADWYEARRAGLGVELVAMIDDALQEIITAPLTCSQWRKDRPFRRKFVRRFPYVIFFTAEADALIVVAIAHTRRRPGYWVERTKK